MDDSLRDLQRRFGSEGDSELGRRLLAELRRLDRAPEILEVRLLLGELSRAKIELAAFLGHAPAQGFFDERAPSDFTAFCEALWRWGSESCLRACLAAADAVVERLEEPPQRNTLRALEAARAWLACPCQEHYRAAERFNGVRGVPVWAYQTVTFAHCPPRSPWRGNGGRWQGCRHHIDALRDAAEILGEGLARSRIEEALIAWALESFTPEETAALGEDAVTQHTVAGDELQLRWLLSRRSTPPKEEQRALMAAIRVGRPELVRLLVEYGYALELPASSHRQPLNEAIRHDDLAMIDSLLELGARPRPSDLALAIGNHDEVLTDRLLDLIDLTDGGGAVPIIAALELGDTALFERLWALGARPRGLTWVISDGDAAQLRRCLEEGIEGSDDFDTPLNDCLLHDRVPAFELCLEYGLSPAASTLDIAGAIDDDRWMGRVSEALPAGQLSSLLPGALAAALKRADLRAVERFLTLGAEFHERSLLEAIEGARDREDPSFLKAVLARGIAQDFDLDELDPIHYLRSPESYNCYTSQDALEMVLLEHFCE